MATVNKIMVLLFLLLTVSCVQKKNAAPDRPTNVPANAIWYGGSDGGCWIRISDTDRKNEFYAEIYYQNNGAIWQKGIFKMDVDSTFSARKLQNKILGYQGDNCIYIRMLPTEKNKAGEYKGLSLIGTGRNPDDSTPPNRPTSIPENAKWYGDEKTGAWMSIEKTDVKNQFYVTVYFEDSLSIRDKGIYELDTTCTHSNFTVSELQSKIYDYGGNRIYLTVKNNGKECYLQLIK